MTYFFFKIKNEATGKKKCNDFEFPYANSLDQIGREDGRDTYPHYPKHGCADTGTQRDLR